MGDASPGQPPATVPNAQAEAGRKKTVDPSFWSRNLNRDRHLNPESIYELRVHGRTPATVPGLEREAGGKEMVEPSIRSRNQSLQAYPNSRCQSRAAPLRR